MAVALEILAERGLAGLSMELVARRAGTGKATIYRRWAGREELAVAALTSLRERAPAEPDTGSFRDDLLIALLDQAGTLAGPTGDLLSGLVGELRRSPRLTAALRGAVVDPPRAALAAAAARAVHRGEVRPDAPWPLVLEIAPALLFRRMFVRVGPVDESFLTTLVDGVVMPLVRR